MELNEFHQTDGWLFKRLDDGSVRIRNEALGVSHVIPAAEWVSVIAHCSPERGSDYAYRAAEAFHRSNVISVPQRPSAQRLAEIRAFFTGGEGWVMKAVDDLFREMNALRTEHDEACAHSLDAEERLHAVARERDEARQDAIVVALAVYGWWPGLEAMVRWGEPDSDRGNPVYLAAERLVKNQRKS